MLIATHSIVGAVAGESVGNPIYALLLGAAIHFLLDAIPHFDTTDNGNYTKRQIGLVLVDGILGALVLAVLFFGHSEHKLNFASGAFGGILPDLLLNVPGLKQKVLKNNLARRVQDFHAKIQSYSLPAVPGLLIQYLISALFVYLYLRFVI